MSSPRRTDLLRMECVSTSAIRVPAGTVIAALLDTAIAWEVLVESACGGVGEDCCAKLDILISNVVFRARHCLAFVLARERKVDGVKRARRLRSFVAMVA